MLKLEISNIEGYLYYLKDQMNNKHILNLEFFDIEKEPEVGNIIYINDNLLNPKYEGYSSSYTFGGLNNEYGKPNINIEDVDVIKLVIEDKEIYLKRLYG